ncbi:hypothetical protein BC332_20973 [Capsicum chinense]|nr:hypothetical protein BC332_20973 [Capsicum chinense]
MVDIASVTLSPTNLLKYGGHQLKLSEMVHFRDYTSSSSKSKYLLIEADDGTILTRLLTETSIVGRDEFFIHLGTLRIAAMMADKQTFSLAVSVLSRIYNALNKRPSQDESDSSHGDRCWKKVKPPLEKQGDSKSYVEILVSSSKTLPTIEKPNNVQILEDPHQSKPQNSSKSVVGPRLKRVTFVIQRGDVKVILNDMSGMGVDISPLQDLLGSFFGMATTYDQEQSTLVDKTITIKELDPYLKAKEHFDLVSRKRDEKFEEVSFACKSLEKVRQKVKKLRACRDSAKQEATEMESKVSAAEEEFSKCSDVSLATTNASKVAEKKKKVLETTLQYLVNYKLYLD